MKGPVPHVAVGAASGAGAAYCVPALQELISAWRGEATTSDTVTLKAVVAGAAIGGAAAHVYIQWVSYISAVPAINMAPIGDVLEDDELGQGQGPGERELRNNANPAAAGGRGQAATLRRQRLHARSEVVPASQVHDNRLTSSSLHLEPMVVRSKRRATVDFTVQENGSFVDFDFPPDKYSLCNGDFSSHPEWRNVSYLHRPYPPWLPA